MEDKREEERFHCNWCNTITNHVLKATHVSPVDVLAYGTGEILNPEIPWDPDQDSYVKYRFWYCKGCDSGVLEIYYDEKPLAPWSEIYPPRTINDVRLKQFLNLPKQLKMIYKEVIYCYHNDLLISCGVGLRSLVEGICADKDISGRNLKQKIDSLKEILPNHIVEQLHSFRYMGNKAVHELEPPSLYQLKIHIDVIESLLDYLYELERKVNRLSRERREET